MQTIELKRHTIWILIGLCLFSLAAVALEIRRGQPAGFEITTQESLEARAVAEVDLHNQPTGTAAAPSELSQDLVPVYLVGAVHKPGIYLVARGSYLYELVEQAGGLREDAAKDEINLALALPGNCHIRIPTESEAAEDPDKRAILVDTASTETLLININSATAEALDQLPGIGPATAKAILDFRERNGPFKSKEDLMQVSGIKQSRLDAIRDLITIS